MRTCVLFTLAVAGLALLTDDASAFGRRNRGGGSGCCGGGYTAAPVYSGCNTCGYGGYGGYGHHHQAYGGCSSCGGYASAAYTGGYVSMGSPCSTCGSGYAGATVGGSAMAGGTITTTDGHTYYRGADGVYYSTPTGTMAGGWWGQPSHGGYYPGTMGYNRGFYSNGYGVYPASGYSSGYYGVYPAGGAQTMPGVNFGGVQIHPGGITLPNPLPNK
jgi:hypothetical protein